MARKTRILILLLAACLVFIGVSYNTLKSGLAPAQPGSINRITVVIPPNTSTAEVARRLKEKDIIRNDQVFVLYCRLNGYDGRLKAGTYALSPGAPMKEIVSILLEGREGQIRVTIPEGYTLEQIANLLAEKKVVSRADFWAAAQMDYPYAFLDGIPRSEKYLEGFLFPDTYFIPPTADAQSIIDMMLRRFDREWTALEPLRAEAPLKDPRQLVTVASMVEKETVYADERPLVAGVIYNRLQKGMPLQVDATVLYALGVHKAKISSRDLKVDSPYNTYLHRGLPPGPIGSPGASSLKAALRPARHNYYYYVYRGDGRHYFSQTYSEHLKAKARYQGS